MSDAYNLYDTSELISALGVKKSKQRIDHMIIKSFLAGVLVPIMATAHHACTDGVAAAASLIG